MEENNIGDLDDFNDINDIDVSNILLNIKNDIISDMRKMENKLLEQINKKWYDIETTNNGLLDKINLMMDNNKKMFESITLQKLKLDKVADMSSFKNRIDPMITTHEIRINSIMNEIFSFKSRYEKIIIDNLTVPGYIGPSSQYKSLSEYLSVLINDFSKMKNDKEQMKIDVKDCKNKIDNYLKNIVSLNDNAVVRSNEYTENKAKSIIEYVNKLLDSEEQKNLEIRKEITENQDKTFKDIKEYMKNFSDVLELKNNMNTILEDKFKDQEIKFKDIKEKIDEKEKRIDILANSLNDIDGNLNEINSILKELQFNVNHNQNDIKKINLKLKNLLNSNIMLNTTNSTNSNNNDENKNVKINKNNENHKNNNLNNNNSSEKKRNISPNKIPKAGINLFKDALMKGQTLLNKKKTELIKDELINLRKKDSKNNVLSLKKNEKEKEKEKEKVKEKIKEQNQKQNEKKKIESENNSQKNNYIEKNLNKKEISLKKYKITNEISCSFIADKKNTNIITANNNIDFSINATKNKLDTNIRNDHDLRIVFKRNSNSEYKPNKKNVKSNFLNSNTVQAINRPNKRNIISNFKSSQLNLNQEEIKVYKTINSDDDIITSVQKMSKGFNINTLTQKNINKKNKNNNNTIYNLFNYKVVSLGDKILLDSDSKDIFALDINNPVNLKKRSIRINLVSPLSHTLKTYRSQKFERKNKNSSPNEVNIKATPAFGSTAYSFYHRKNFPNITVGKTQ